MTDAELDELERALADEGEDFGDYAGDTYELIAEVRRLRGRSNERALRDRIVVLEADLARHRQNYEHDTATLTDALDRARPAERLAEAVDAWRRVHETTGHALHEQTVAEVALEAYRKARGT